jgi:hypothetical protein
VAGLSPIAACAMPKELAIACDDGFGVLIGGIPPGARCIRAAQSRRSKGSNSPEIIHVLNSGLRPTALSPLRTRHGNMVSDEPSRWSNAQSS